MFSSSSTSRYVSLPGAQPGIFLGRGVFLEYGHFDKNFMYDMEKKGAAGKNFDIIFRRYS